MKKKELKDKISALESVIQENEKLFNKSNSDKFEIDLSIVQSILGKYGNVSIQKDIVNQHGYYDGYTEYIISLQK